MGFRQLVNNQIKKVNFFVFASYTSGSETFYMKLFADDIFKWLQLIKPVYIINIPHAFYCR